MVAVVLGLIVFILVVVIVVVRPMHPSQVGPSTAATLPPDVYIRPRK